MKYPGILFALATFLTAIASVLAIKERSRLTNELSERTHYAGAFHARFTAYELAALSSGQPKGQLDRNAHVRSFMKEAYIYLLRASRGLGSVAFDESMSAENFVGFVNEELEKFNKFSVEQEKIIERLNRREIYSILILSCSQLGDQIIEFLYYR